MSSCSTFTSPTAAATRSSTQVAPERPGVRFLALSVSDAAEDVIAVIRAGARGYVTKTISGEELAAAIEQVANGDAVFSPRLAGFVLDAFRAGDRVGGDADLDELTPREREVLQLIARGYMYKEIAARLHLSVKTVESHVSNVLRKLQLSTRHELARWATEHRSDIARGQPRQRGGTDGRQGGLHRGRMGCARERRHRSWACSSPSPIATSPTASARPRRSRSISQPTAAVTAQLVRELSKAHGTGFGLVASPTEVEEGTTAALATAMTTLAAKAPAEVDAYRAFVLEVANAAAEAKGGVAEEETAAIAKITAALG